MSRRNNIIRQQINWTVLCDSIFTGISYAGLRDLVKTGWDATQSVDRYGSTALLWAAGEGHIEVCRYLVDFCGANVNELRGKDGMKRHALHWAARNGRLVVAKWLVDELGVNPDVPTGDGTTPLHFAAFNAQLHMCRWLIEECKCDVHILNGYGCNASQWSALRGDVEVMRYLQSAGVDFRALNLNGHSALHKVAIKGHEEACVWLTTPIEKGGAGLGLEHLQMDDDGFTPMLFARANGHTYVANILSQFYEEKQLEI